MPPEKQQKVEVAGMANAAHAREQHRRIRYAGLLPRGAARNRRDGRSGHHHLPVSSFNASSNVSTGKGLRMAASAPATPAVDRYLSGLQSTPPLDMAMILSDGDSRLTAIMVSSPSISGMKRSVTITSNGRSRRSSSARAPFDASSTS